MFATLKYRPQSSLSQVGNTASSRRTSTGVSRLACVNCRKKKLRCSGECPACERCRLKGLECTYPKRTSRTGNKTTTNSDEGSAQKKDQSKSLKPPEGTQPPKDNANANSDVSTVPASRAGSTELDSSRSQTGELSAFGPTSLIDEGLDCEMQLPTPIDTGVGSSKGSPSESAGAEAVSTEGDPSLDLAAYDYDFPPSGFDFYGLDSGLSPLGPSSFSSAWFDPIPMQHTESANISSKMPTPSPSKCKCVHLAVMTLEEAAPGTELASFSLAQSVLAAHKQSLTQCEMLLACPHCSSPSSVMMLVLMVLDKLITSFRQIHAFSQSWTGLLTPDDAGGLLRQAAQLTDEVRDRRISLGDYQIDSSNEWSRVMDVLLLFQMSRLNRLLMKLRARVNSAKEESQLHIIEQIEDRFRTFLTNFERSTSFSIC